jgi:hypothetical protein
VNAANFVATSRGTPVPFCPDPLNPQAHTVPSHESARLCSAPAAMPTKPVAKPVLVVTRTGRSRSLGPVMFHVPSPI